jgi:hypothetical protein
MTNIQTQAFKVGKKPQKSRVQSWIEELYDESEIPKQKQKFAEMYKYFMPPIPKKASSPIEWVGQARATGNIRPHLQAMYLRGGRLSGTDGARLHAIEIEGKEDGYYDCHMNKLEIDYTYPNVEKVIPQKNHHYGLDMVEVGAEKFSDTEVASIVYFGDLKYTFNTKYLHQMMMGSRKVDIYLEKIVEGQPVLFDFGDNRLGVLMPRKNKEGR